MRLPLAARTLVVEGFGTVPRTKNGPALAGYGAVTMKNALAASMTTLPEQLRRSLACVARHEHGTT